MMIKIKDSVHGEIHLPDYIHDICTNEIFQRLRNIRQLGVSFYYFKNANHSRFEHSIGTAYLCGKLLDIIEKNSDVKIEDHHRKCVVLAGLFHDLGHGPFSHLWENVVRKGSHKNWTHEDQSVMMIHHMIRKHKIMLHQDTAMHEQMIELICSLITGDFKVWNRLLKPSEMFLTEVVSNKYCNIDVDKFDYIARDYNCVGRELMPFEDFLYRARIVYDAENVSHIGYHADDFHLIENLFLNRANYHMDVYQFPKVAGIEKQFRDICNLANLAGFELQGYAMVEIQRDCEKYCYLDDTILDLIRNYQSDHPLMKKAQELIKQLDCGQFYELIWEAKELNEINSVFDKLVNQFGDIFCTVDKYIPNAQVPSNIPLYDDAENNVQKISNLQLSYKSIMIFCKAFDPEVIKNIGNFLNNNET